jgi:hypothetical protein
VITLHRQSPCSEFIISELPASVLSRYDQQDHAAICPEHFTVQANAYEPFSAMTMLDSIGRKIISGFCFKDMARDPMPGLISHRCADYNFCGEIMVAKCSYPFDKDL